MSVQERIDTEYAILLSHPIVQSTDLIKRTVTRLDGYLRVRCRLTNSDFLEIAIHVLWQNGQAVINGYRYQWMDSARINLRRRWDDTPHFPHLPGFPHHCHVEREDNIEPASPLNIKSLLDWISQNMK